MADLAERYRFEGQTACIDVRLKSAAAIFDPRDPAPLPDRDLDAEVSEYITASVEELPDKVPVKLVFWLAEPSPVAHAELAAGIARHFTFDRVRAARQVRHSLRQARWMLVVGLVTLAFFLTLGELTLSWETHPVGKVVHTGFTIFGWVAMWRPLEALLYDWWPLIVRRRYFERIERAPVELREGRGPTAS
jgi:hypothetical protein